MARRSNSVLNRSTSCREICMTVVSNRSCQASALTASVAAANACPSLFPYTGVASMVFAGVPPDQAAAIGAGTHVQGRGTHPPPPKKRPRFHCAPASVPWLRTPLPGTAARCRQGRSAPRACAGPSDGNAAPGKRPRGAAAPWGGSAQGIGGMCGGLVGVGVCVQGLGAHWRKQTPPMSAARACRVPKRARLVRVQGCHAGRSSHWQTSAGVPTHQQGLIGDALVAQVVNAELPKVVEQLLLHDAPAVAVERVRHGEGGSEP